MAPGTSEPLASPGGRPLAGLPPGSQESERRREARTLALLVAALVAIATAPFLGAGAPVDWRAHWLVAALIGGVSGLAAFEIHAREEPRGVPIETLVTPALAAVALVGTVPLAAEFGVHPALALVAVLGLGVPLLEASLEWETPFVRLGAHPGPEDRRRIEGLLLGVSFLAFAAVQVTLPGGWPHAGIDVPGGPLGDYAVLIGLADAALALPVGYRLTTLSGAATGVGWASGGYAVIVGWAAVLFRWLAVPGLLAGALLVALVALRLIVSTASGPEATPRWRLEALAIGLALLSVVVYHLLRAQSAILKP